MVLGHWLEMRAISQARGALNALAALLPDTAERVSGTETRTVPISDLKVGDVVLVRPGTRVPADGEVVEGSADVDESMITGESRSVSKAPGGKVIAGTVAAGGSLRVRIMAVGEQTALSGIMRLVAAAQASGSHTQDLADRAAANPFLCGRRIWSDYFRLLVACGGQRTCPDQDGNRPHHCLPACLGIGHSACDCDLDIDRGSEWSSPQGQTRTRTRPEFGHGDLR